MEADRIGGSLIPVQWAVEVFGGQLDAIKVKLDTIPVRAAPLVVGQPNLGIVQRNVRRFVEEIKAEVRNYGQELARQMAQEEGVREMTPCSKLLPRHQRLGVCPTVHQTKQ